MPVKKPAPVIPNFFLFWRNVAVPGVTSERMKTEENEHDFFMHEFHIQWNASFQTILKGNDILVYDEKGAWARCGLETTEAKNF